MNKRLIIFLLIFIVGSFAGIVGYSCAKITNFEECENAGWLIRKIIVYDYYEVVYDSSKGFVEKKCVLWNGKSFIKQGLRDDKTRAIEIATAHLSYPTTIIEVKELECSGCFSVTLQRDDNQQQFTITLNDWKITN